MKISIIIATMNSAVTLERCLSSIFTQKNSNYELVIKDGGSTDGTIDILNKYESKIDWWSSLHDLGVYDAFNIALDKVTGDWIIFLGSDDYFLNENYLADIVSELDKAIKMDCHLVYGKNLIIDISGKELREIGEAWDVVKERIDLVMTVRHPGCFHSKFLIDKVGYFDLKYKIAADHHYILRCLKFTTPYFYNFVGVVHQNGGLSTDPARTYQLIKETYLIRKHLNIKPWFFPDLHFLKRLFLFAVFSILGRNAVEYLLSIFNYLKRFLFPHRPYR